MVKSHHNVGGLPEDLQFELVEPLKQLFKDEVRACGIELGLPHDMVYRQPVSYTHLKEDSKKSQVRLVSVTDLSKYIKVGEYKDLSLERVLVPVVDEEVEAEIDYRLQEKAEEVQDAAAEEGDQVRISFSGTIDGQSFDGSTEEDYDIVVGESGIADGFDDGIRCV